MKVFLVAICVAITTARPSSDWLEWKAKHNKQYETQADEMDRFDIWSTNMAIIDDHNARDLGFELEMNEFGDMTDEEFRETVLTNIGPPSERSNASAYVRQGIEVDEEVDWRTKGYVTEVKNQGACGSCWAFSATGSLEGQHFKKTGNLVSLSEQNLVDCSTAEGNHGCKGGLMDRAFEYIERNNGIDTEESYPYTAKDGFCRFQESDVGATLTGYTDILPREDENALKEAAATVGPISVAMDAGHTSFRFYKSGVYYERACSSVKLNHGVLVVGYGTLEMEDYWLVKNSWGTTWGNRGYFMIARNRENNCGIATQASYPKV